MLFPPMCVRRQAPRRELPKDIITMITILLLLLPPYGRGDGLEVEPMSRNPEGRSSIPRLGSLRSSLISIELRWITA